MIPEVPLRDYIERIVLEHEQRNLERIRNLERQVANLESLVEAKQRALALAVEKQEAAYNARFANVNEFRASLNDAVNRTVTREYVEARFIEIDRRLATIEANQAAITAEAIGQAKGYAVGIGLVVLIISVASQLLNLGG